MTGSELYSYILKDFKRTDKSTEMYQAITDTVRDILSRHPFDVTRTEAQTSAGFSAAGDYKLALPSDVGKLILIRLIDGDDSFVMGRLTKDAYDRKYPNQGDEDVDTGTPKEYCIFNNEIQVGPATDSTDYELEIVYSEELAADVDASTTSVTFSGEHRETLKAGALFRMYNGLEEYERAAVWERFYEKGIEQMIKRDNDRADAPARVNYNDL
jgi:hypothetical protein